MILNQTYLFLIFTINGIIIGTLFDTFRILRKTFKTSNTFTYLEDILFWLLTSFILLYTIFKFSNGEIRFFMFLGVFLGVTIYMLTLSKTFIKVNVKILLIFKKIVGFLLNTILLPIKKILHIIKKVFTRQIKFITINIKKINKPTFFSKKKKDFLRKSRKI